jgi:hypothetical protein
MADDKGPQMTDMVCAWCDVYARIPCEMCDDQGRVISTWTKCAYCERSELRFRKLGRQTPIPKQAANDRIDGCPF